MPKFRFRFGVLVFSWLVMFIFLLSFVNKKQAVRQCSKIIVNLDNQFENYFIEEQDVVNLLTSNGRREILGQLKERINLKQIENQIKDHGFVESAQVSMDMAGNVVANVKQCIPIARVVNPYGADVYISDKGKILPMSPRYTARVLTVYMNQPSKFTKYNWAEDSVCKPYFELVNILNESEFNKAMFAQIDIETNGKVIITPQIGKIRIEMGYPQDLELKFKKIDRLYKEIIPNRGWSRYSRCNIEYKDQIICE